MWKSNNWLNVMCVIANSQYKIKGCGGTVCYRLISFGDGGKTLQCAQGLGVFSATIADGSLDVVIK